ncbi:MAG TPA: hypothetical protein VMK16_19580 [Acidimicrobiales bacterium]|nr:hypothetical protein [Acidimicrobiales bacterium]
MKLAELRTNDGRALVLHPRLAVVEADEQTRRSVISALAAALRDGGPAAGYVEVHGLLLDLDRDTMRVLDLDPELSLVLGSDDLPTELFGVDGRRRRAADDVAAKQRELVDARKQQVQAALDVVTAVQAALRTATVERDEAADALEHAQAGLAAAISSRDAADRAVETLTAAAAEEAEAALAPAVDEPLEALDPVDDASVDADEVDDGEDDEEDGGDPWAEDRVARERAVAAAEKRVVTARAEVEHAARAANPARLDQADRDALDAAHEAVLDADDRASKRFGGAGARKRLDEARAVEREVLDRLGLDSYSDFLLRSSMGTTDPSAELRLDMARTELVEAERALSSARTAADAVPAPPPPRAPRHREPKPSLQPAAREPAVSAPAPAPAPVVSTAGESAARLAAAMRARDDAATVELRADAAHAAAAATLADAEAKLIELAVRHDEAEQSLAQARVRVDAALAEVARIAETNGHPSDPSWSERADTGMQDEIDRHLLAWLAARGQHPLADPLPIVLDEVYRHVGVDDLEVLLGRLDHLADSLHVVYLTEDPNVLHWAATMAPERGGLTLPGRR